MCLAIVTSLSKQKSEGAAWQTSNLVPRYPHSGNGRLYLVFYLMFGLAYWTQFLRGINGDLISVSSTVSNFQ